VRGGRSGRRRMIDRTSRNTAPSCAMTSGLSHRAFRALNGDTPYLGNWHLEVMGRSSKRCAAARFRRLAIALPPRHLKSHMCRSPSSPSVLGHHPARQIICASYSQDLSRQTVAGLPRADGSELLSRIVRHRTFARPQRPRNSQPPKTRLPSRHFGRAAWLTGARCDLIVIDDPLKAEEAYSDARRGSVNEWFDTALVSRLNDKEKAAIVIVMQRLHETIDRSRDARRRLGIAPFPAIAEENSPCIGLRPPYGPRLHAPGGRHSPSRARIRRHARAPARADGCASLSRAIPEGALPARRRDGDSAAGSALHAGRSAGRSTSVSCPATPPTRRADSATIAC